MPNKLSRNAGFDSEPDMIVFGTGQSPDLEKYTCSETEAAYSRFRCLPRGAKFEFLLSLLLDLAILSGFAAAFWTPLARMAAMTGCELSHAYPLIGLNFVVVLPLRG